MHFRRKNRIAERIAFDREKILRKGIFTNENRLFVAIALYIDSYATAIGQRDEFIPAKNVLPCMWFYLRLQNH